MVSESVASTPTAGAELARSANSHGEAVAPVVEVDAVDSEYYAFAENGPFLRLDSPTTLLFNVFVFVSNMISHNVFTQCF